MDGAASAEQPASHAAGPVGILRDLIRFPSVTPEGGAALDYLTGLLTPWGFSARRLVFGSSGQAVDNLFLRYGEGAPHLCFAGHVDVVPPGAEEQWRHPPFAAVVEDGVIYGRGACDMKGAIAAFTVAARDYLNARGRGFRGSVSLLLTSDEEGPAINGTARVLPWLAEQGEIPDHCLVGEPASGENCGDAIKIGRRGSAHFEIICHGRQGHSAYPQRAANPIAALARLVDRLSRARLDDGTDFFDPSTLAVTSFDAVNPAGNVIPSLARARVNIRYNPLHDAAGLHRWIEAHGQAVAADGIAFDVIGAGDSVSFLTDPDNALVRVVQAAIVSQTGNPPALSTAGGTSDARFIKDYCPVIECGSTGKTMHQTDECIAVAEVEQLTRLYGAILERYFAEDGPSVTP